MASRSQDPHRRGTLIRDKDGDVWRKGTAWWHWTGRSIDTGPGKLMWNQLMEMYGPVTFVSIPGGPRCAVCHSSCTWAEDAWRCDRTSCGSEWNSDHGPEYVAPGDRG